MMSTRPVAISVPSTAPRTVIWRATMSPMTTASAPTITTWCSFQMGPSTRPSISRSSTHSTLPRIVIVRP